MERSKVYEIADTERDHQDRKWGTIVQNPHEVGGWLLLIENSLRQAKESGNG